VTDGGRLPDFFLVGAAKSGTTALASALRRHPDVFLPTLKEPHFYAYLADPESVRMGYVDDADARRRYRQLYAATGDAVAVGDGSTSNLTVPGAAAAIAAEVPGARIVAILRHPVDRAFSAWSHFRAAGAETLDFADAVRAEPARLAAGVPVTYQFLGRGRYSEQLPPYYDLFGRERVLVHLYDDFVADSAAVLRATLDFLGVDASQPLPSVTRDNVIRVPRFAGVKGRTGRLLRRATPGPWKHQPPPRLDPAVRDRLVREELADEIDRLEALMGRDLSRWRARSGR
jgi:hypothetical protein